MKPETESREQDRIDLEAAVWFEMHNSGLSPEQEAELQRWLAADTRNNETWQEFTRALHPLQAIQGSTEADDLVFDLAQRRNRARNRKKLRLIFGSTTALAAAAAVAILLLRPNMPASPDAIRAAGTIVISQPEKRMLPDGSVIELNAGAIVETTFTPTRRNVQLITGEAHFSVAKDPARPFVVLSQGVEVCAVGTAFSVATSQSGVSVLVTQGRVSVAHTAENPVGNAGVPETSPVFADAGMRVSISPAATPKVSLITPDAIQRDLAWRTPLLELSGSTLAEAVTALNRENRIQIQVADQDLAKLQLTGTFRMDDAEGFVRVLETYFGVTVKRDGLTLSLQKTH